jgi:hypothetical protein
VAACDIHLARLFILPSAEIHAVAMSRLFAHNDHAIRHLVDVSSVMPIKLSPTQPAERVMPALREWLGFSCHLLTVYIAASQKITSAIRIDMKIRFPLRFRFSVHPHVC